MSILRDLSEMFRLVASTPPSTYEDIRNLSEKATIKVPEEYIELLNEGNGFEFHINNKKYIRIWGANDCIKLNKANDIQEELPESLAIGDNGDGDALIYLLGNEGFGLYLSSFSVLDVDEAIKIAPSLRDLLVNNVGVDKLLP